MLNSNRKVPPEILVSLNQISDLNKLADTMSAHLELDFPINKAF